MPSLVLALVLRTAVVVFDTDSFIIGSVGKFLLVPSIPTDFFGKQAFYLYVTLPSVCINLVFWHITTSLAMGLALKIESLAVNLVLSVEV